MKVLICDDSALARKSLSRMIHSLYDVDLVFAENGKQALEVLVRDNIDLFFLDLTMPVMDGYDVLGSLPVSKYPTRVVVVSGDVQKEAKERCMLLGAQDFIEKPFKPEELAALMTGFSVKSSQAENIVDSEPEVDPDSKFKELTNIALGRCAALVSDSVGDFIHMPLPAVGVLEPSDIEMTIQDVLRDSVNAVTQRFTGAGIHGESIVTIRGSGFSTVSERLGYPLDDTTDNEQLLNISNLLVSTYLRTLADLITVSFTLRQPVLISGHEKELLSQQRITKPAFTVEFSYSAENLDFQCEVLFLIDMGSVGIIYKMMESF